MAEQVNNPNNNFNSQSSSQMPAFQMPSFSPPPFTNPTQAAGSKGQTTQSGSGKSSSGSSSSNNASPFALAGTPPPTSPPPSSGNLEYEEPNLPTTNGAPINPLSPPSGYFFAGSGGGTGGTVRVMVGQTSNYWWDQIWTYQSTTALTPAQLATLHADALSGMSTQTALSSLNLSWTCISADNVLTHIPTNMQEFKEWFPKEYGELMEKIAMGIALQIQQQMQQANNQMKEQWAQMNNDQG